MTKEDTWKSLISIPMRERNCRNCGWATKLTGSSLDLCNNPDRGKNGSATGCDATGRKTRDYTGDYSSEYWKQKK